MVVKSFFGSDSSMRLSYPLPDRRGKNRSGDVGRDVGSVTNKPPTGSRRKETSKGHELKKLVVMFKYMFYILLNLTWYIMVFGIHMLESLNTNFVMMDGIRSWRVGHL